MFLPPLKIDCYTVQTGTQSSWQDVTCEAGWLELPKFTPHHITPQTWKLQPKTWQGSQLWSITAVNINTPGPCRYVGCTGICWELEAFWQVCVGYSPSIKQSIKSIVCFCEWWHLLRTIHWLWLGSIKIYVSVSGRITVVVIALVAVFNLIYTTYFNLMIYT